MAQHSNAVTILHRRYVKGDTKRMAELLEEPIDAEVSRIIRNARRSAGLTQKQLAEQVGVTPSVIRWMEKSNYDRHSLSMLVRVAKATGRNLTVAMTAPPPKRTARRR